MVDVKVLHEVAVGCIDSNAESLHSINKQLHANPETAYKEFFAHQLLTTFLIEQGFQVEKSYTLETAFKATIECGKGPNVAVLCEYDALPDIGHGCGHNLISEAGVAAALGIKAAMEKAGKGNNLGKLTVYGTPAEEGGGGKIAMIESGCFKDVDFAMMVHGSSFDSSISNLVSMLDVTVIYHGKNAHASLLPWEGVNAVDAAVQCYNTISSMRQQFKPSWRVHGIIVDGGIKPSIIPEKSELNFYFRAPSEDDLKQLANKCEGCFHAAAESSGCTVEINYNNVCGDHYVYMLNNRFMADRYEVHASKLGIKFPSYAEQRTLPAGSSDMGNVSQIIPSIHPFFDVNTDVPKHSIAFAEASGTDQAHHKTIIAGKAMALLAIDIFVDAAFREQIVREFKNETSGIQ